MTQFSILEDFPYQVLSFQHLERIVEVVYDEFKRGRIDNSEPPPPSIVRRTWPHLSKSIGRAILDTRIYGASAATIWVPVIDAILFTLSTRMSLTNSRQLYILYTDYVDTLYGAILCHALRNLPTATCTRLGHLDLAQVRFFRYTMVRNRPEKSALEQVLELMYMGGPRVELEYRWTMIGERKTSLPQILTFRDT